MSFKKGEKYNGINGVMRRKKKTHFHMLKYSDNSCVFFLLKMFGQYYSSTNEICL